MDRLLEIASSVSTPLALGGLVVGILFLLVRQIISLGIFPALNRVLGAHFLKTIVDRLFVLALTAMVLGFIAYMARYLPGVIVEDPSFSNEQKAAETFLKRLYQRDLVAVYDSITPSFRETTSFTQFAGDTRKELRQFQDPPRYRRLKTTVPSGSAVTLVYEAEFDDVSKVHELVTFNQQGAKKELWRFDLYPANWPLNPVTQIVPERTATEMKARAVAVDETKRSYDGYYSPREGLKLVVDHVGKRLAAATCDVATHEEGTQTVVNIRRLLGGCSLVRSERISAFGQVLAVSEEYVELDSVRFMPL